MAVAAGQSQRQRFYSGVGVFNWQETLLKYPSSPPQVLLRPGSGLETGGLMSSAGTVLYIYEPSQAKPRDLVVPGGNWPAIGARKRSAISVKSAFRAG